VLRFDRDSPPGTAHVVTSAPDNCRHDRAPLRRLGIITHERTGQRVYVLLCTECGFTVTTEMLRRQRSATRARRAPAPTSGAPQWAPLES